LDFHQSTAEQVIGAAQAAHISADPVDAALVARFLDTTDSSAENALSCAADLGLLKTESDGRFSPSSRLCRYVDTGNVLAKAAVLRISLDSFMPFQLFTDRLRLHGEAKVAAQETVALLDLDAHWEDVKATLLDFGTYTQVLTTSGQGEVAVAGDDASPLLADLTNYVHSIASDEAAVRLHTGSIAAGIELSEADVVLPLLTAVDRASTGQAEDAVHHAGNAVESFLVAYGARAGITANQSSITSKADYIRGQNAAMMPKKLLVVATFLGSGRNAADHGVDSDTNSTWDISNEFALSYVLATFNFIRAVMKLESDGTHLL